MPIDYSEDIESLESKRNELIAIAAEALGPRDRHLADRVVNSFCATSPPLDPPILMEMITVHSLGRGGGMSRKPGNLILNWRKLAGEFGDLSLTVASVATESWLIPFAALSIWNKVWTHSAIELSKDHATVLYAMWQGRNVENEISHKDAFEKSALMFSINGWAPLERQAFEDIICDLNSLEAIETKESVSIWLRECVKTTYK